MITETGAEYRLLNTLRANPVFKRMERRTMGRVVKRENVQEKNVYRVGCCLKGYIDGKFVVRYIEQSPRRQTVDSHSVNSWVQTGFFFKDLLSE
jgi:hypothetical protein